MGLWISRSTSRNTFPALHPAMKPPIRFPQSHPCPVTQSPLEEGRWSDKWRSLPGALKGASSQNHEIVWGGKDLQGHLVPTPAPWAATLSLDQHYLCELVHCPRPSSHPVAERVFVAFSTWLKPLPSHHQREDRHLTDMGMGESILRRLNLSSWDLTSSLDYTRSIYSTSLICFLLPLKVCDQLRDTPCCGQEV